MTLLFWYISEGLNPEESLILSFGKENMLMNETGQHRSRRGRISVQNKILLGTLSSLPSDFEHLDELSSEDSSNFAKVTTPC